MPGEALATSMLMTAGDLARELALSVKTIRRGRQEVAASLETRPTERVRLVGGGRPRAEKKIQR